WTQRWFDTRLLPATHLDVGLQNAIRTSIGYVGIVIAAAMAFAHLGLDFQKLAIVAGALSVGIGFGLQSVVNNFVSGLIILWERAIRVGDLVLVGEDQGHVKRINVRATEIETFDRVTMIVPNSNLVSGIVKNWVRSDRVARIKIPLALNLNADPDVVRELLLSCARDNDAVIKLPAPQAFFTAIADSALKFELICFVDDVETMARVKSDLHFEIFRRLRQAGLELPPTASAPGPVTVHVNGVETFSSTPKPAPPRAVDNLKRSRPKA
ncbi:MAG TPA: mechanosensitive ion channel domain-containing protein, partial [Beijerinckiaceae bacterium]|nr:mechanosensitive ion channel domain-containing protein [Beijerinckiaceae bacterium]